MIRLSAGVPACLICVYSWIPLAVSDEKTPPASDERAKAIEALIASLEKLQATGASNKDLIAQLDGELKKFTGEFEAAQKQVEQTGQTLAEKKKSYDQLMTETKAARDKLNELEGKLAATKAEVDQLGKTVADAQGAQAGAQKRIEALKTSIALLQKIDSAGEKPAAPQPPAEAKKPAAPATKAPDPPALSAEQVALARAGVAVLQANCLTCHGKDNKFKSGLDMRTRATLWKGGDRGPAVVAGKAAESLLVKVMLIKKDDETDDVPHMPPKKEIAADDIEKVKKWIDGGAHFPPPAELAK